MVSLSESQEPVGYCRADLAATGPEMQRDQKLVDEGFKGRERLQVDGRKRRQGKRLEMLMHVVSSTSGDRHRLGCKESRRRRCKETSKKMTIPNANSCTRLLTPSFSLY